jgi:acyl-CoA hydrolase
MKNWLIQHHPIRESKSSHEAHVCLKLILPAPSKVIIEIGIEVVKFETSSLTLKCEENMMTRETIISIASTTMVNLGEDGKPKAHGKTEIEFVKNRL